MDISDKLQNYAQSRIKALQGNRPLGAPRQNFWVGQISPSTP